MTGHTTDIEGGGSLEVGAWDQRQRGIGRHFSMVKQFYIFILITFLLLRFSCMHTMHSTCSQLHPSQLPLFPGQFLSLSSLSPGQLPSLPIVFHGQFPNPTSSLLWSIAQPSPPSSIPHPYLLSSLVKSSFVPISFPHSDLFALFVSLWV